MTVAGIKNARRGSGLDAGHKTNNSLVRNNISNIYAFVNKLMQRWSMNREEIERAASVWALMFRDMAPIHVQLLFTGRPSFYSEDAKTLALAFLVVYAMADDRLKALGGDMQLDAAACWQAALKLAGGTYAE